MQAAISWLEEREVWRKAMLIRDYKSLVHAVGNLLVPGEGIGLMKAAIALLNAEKCLDVLWFPGYRDLQSNELADE